MVRPAEAQKREEFLKEMGIKLVLEPWVAGTVVENKKENFVFLSYDVSSSP